MKTNKVKRNFSTEYMSEFSIWNGENFVTFNIIELNEDRQTITVEVSDAGRLSPCTFDLVWDDKRGLCFEYGVTEERIAVKDFEQIEED